MPELEQNDANMDQPVTDSSETQPVAQAEGVPVESLTTEQVPFNEDPKIQEYIERQVGKVAEKLSAAELQNQQYQQMLMAQNAQQPQQQATSQEEQIKAYLVSRGIDPEYATPMQMTQVFMEIQNEYSTKVNNQIQSQQLMSELPDFGNVVGVPNAEGVVQFPAQPLNQYVQKHPEQSQIIMQNLSTAQGKKLVYQAIVNDPDYRKANLDAQTVPKVTKEAQAMINNANSIGSISNAGSASAMDKTAELTAMDDIQFQKHLESVKARA